MEWYKPTKTYENGIYVHQLQLYFDPLGGGTDGLKIYVAKDANGNGTYDSGEEAKVVTTEDGKYDAGKSTLWYDGSFLPGTVYSAYVEFASRDVRLDADMAVNYTELDKKSEGTSAVLSFPADNTIRTIFIVTAAGEETADPVNRDPMNLADANPGYSTAFEVYKHKEVSDAASDAEVSTFYQGKDISALRQQKNLFFTVRSARI